MEPGKPWGIHEASYGDSVSGVRVDMFAYLLNSTSKLLHTVEDELPAMPLHKVVVPSNQHYIHGLVVELLLIVQPEGVHQVLNAGFWDGNVVGVLNITTVVGA